MGRFEFQRIRSTVDEKEQKQLLMDLEVVMKSNECPCIVQFYGALFKEVSQILKSLICILLTKSINFIVKFRFISKGRLLDMHGINGYFIRQVLQIHLREIERKDTRMYLR